MCTSGNTFPPVTPPPVVCPIEPSKIVARNNSKKSGSRFSDATTSRRLMSEAGLPFWPSKLPPVFAELGEVYTHCCPIGDELDGTGWGVRESQTKPKQVLMFAAVPA